MEDPHVPRIFLALPPPLPAPCVEFGHVVPVFIYFAYRLPRARAVFCCFEISTKLSIKTDANGYGIFLFGKSSFVLRMYIVSFFICCLCFLSRSMIVMLLLKARGCNPFRYASTRIVVLTVIITVAPRRRLMLR